MAVVFQRPWRMVVAVASVALLVAFGLPLFFPRAGSGHDGEDEERSPVRIEHPENLVELHFTLGVRDTDKDTWEGELTVSQGRLLQLQIVQAARDSSVDGARFKVKDVRTKKNKNNKQSKQNQQQNSQTDKASTDSNQNNTGEAAADKSSESKSGADTNTNKANKRNKNTNRKTTQRSNKDVADSSKSEPGKVSEAADQITDRKNADGKSTSKKQSKSDKSQDQEEYVFTPARLRALLDAPPESTVTMATSQGDFSFSINDLGIGTEKKFLEGKASVRRERGAMPLTGKSTEDDFPAGVRGKDGAIWVAYVAYHPGPTLVNERVFAGNFELLEPADHGDQIRLMRFDGTTWHSAPPATDKGQDVWRPTITIDGGGGIWVAWAQKQQDNWNILARRYQPDGASGVGGKWDEVVTVSDSPGSDFHVVAATDARGKVWLAWQGWRGDNYDILLASQTSGSSWTEPKTISKSRRNDWGPGIAADSRGRVYVAFDTYDRDNFDVMLHVEDPGKSERAPLPLADSARFEARVHLFCDVHDRLWAAYEEGDEAWGKDYASDDGYKKVGLERNPGYALYVNRTIRVKCLDGATWKEPATKLADAFGEQLKRNKSHPRLSADSSEGLWLFFRHHPLANGSGEVWQSYAMRYDGEEWSHPRPVPGTMNLLDNRPVVQPFRDGVLVVSSSDNRTKTADRSQDDLYMSTLSEDNAVSGPELVAVTANPPAKVEPYHKNEREMVKMLRKFRLNVGGQELRLVRGEFHRHTEYTAHRDQDGSLEDSWRYSLDPGYLDWMGNGDHDNGGDEYMWWTDQKQSDLHHNPPHFVAAMTYERSVVYPNGHRNVMMPRRGIRPLPRGETKGTAEEGTPDTKMLYGYLKHFGGICAIHTSATNMGTDWRDNDPDVEPIVEVYQGHRHNYEHFGAPRSPTEQTQIGGYQAAGFIWNALEKGYKLGFQSSSDHVSTHMSYACVFVPENSRQAIIDAFKKRHCYGATDNILLVTQSGPYMMGDIFTSKERPNIKMVVHGGQPIAKVSLVRDNKYVYTAEPGTREFDAEYRDADAKPGETHFYYVRVEQSDGNLAWGSPMWITYQP